MKLIRITELMEITGLSMSTLMRMERTGRLPRRRKVSKQAMAWLSDEIEAWMRALPVTPRGQNPVKPAQQPQGEAQATPADSDVKLGNNEAGRAFLESRLDAADDARKRERGE
jgi:predicted DNA-binding transcriptional regulator AlpA